MFREKRRLFFMPDHLSKAFIFGAGSVGKGVLPHVQKQYQVTAFLDNDKTKWNQTFEGIPVYEPKSILDADYDIVVIASQAGLHSITEQLLGLGVDRSEICTKYIDFSVRSRIVFLEKLGELFREQNIQGCIAECGVFQGEFAQEINRVFPAHKLYLFDTFSGFDPRDVEIEHENQYTVLGAGHFNITSEGLVLGKLPHPEMCVIRKGYFPETASGLEEERFCFVTLDFDLYQPTLAGLQFFAPRMTESGVILIHDYFADGFKGVRAAVNDFDPVAKGLRLLPIGDGLSVAIYF